MYNVNFFIKRFFDILLSVIAIIVVAPMWVIVAIAIKFDSEGPVFFCQQRLTKDGKTFKMYKFRTMVVDAEHRGTGLFNYADDPRVTKVGRFLRDTSIDELPQLFNVLKGELSIVGPRPPVTYELGDYSTLNAKYKRRFSMRGGLTGLAQIKGRNENSWEEKVYYDNLYISLFEKQGVWLDIKIILETFIEVFSRKNICEENFSDSLSDIEAAKLAAEEVIRLAHLPDEDVVEV